MNTMPDETRQLYEAASRDKMSFDLLFETGRAPNETMGFLAQQTCEKCIKAILVLHGISIDRTHDLERLYEIAVTGAIKIPASVDALRQLNPYAVSFRYEASDVEWMSEEEIRTLIDSMYEWATAKIGK
uniref:HEPN domain-containing protein n=1 Tax=Candidatus Kentrum sp. TUN TaxID=2126343 RepID=A0A450ZKR9_9GAMM|nr:MAG: HEPN domain-containing protein [Candidatus Kentron sp. TUN]